MASMDTILALDHPDWQVSGAIAEFALLDGGITAWRLWPGDVDTAFVAEQLTRHGHLFVVSEDSADLHRAIHERYGL